MIKGKIKLDVFSNWTINFAVAKCHGDKDVIKYIKKYNTDTDTESEFIDNLTKEGNGGALNATNIGANKCLIIFYYQKNTLQLIKTVTHEVSHVVDNVCESLYIDDTETKAYLTGYINEQIIKKIL